MLIDVDAERWLRSVTYYRLSGYLFSYRRTDPVGGRQQRSDSFVPGTPLSQVVALYEFDRILRARVHDGLGMVEVAVRRGLADALGREGPVAYQDPSRFRTGFDHGAWLERANRRVDRVARRSDSIRHHLEKYGGDVPLWVLVDVLDFADLSLLFAGARASDQWAVADDLGLVVDLEALNGNQRAKAAGRHPLVNWLEQLTLVRNICAHHARLWNRTVIPAGTAAMRTVPGLESLPHSQSEGVFGALCVVARARQTVSPASDWARGISVLVATHLEATAGRAASEMGFPSGWRGDPLWMSQHDQGRRPGSVAFSAVPGLRPYS
ncbi:Abi family protein [Rathayibacter sp. VKM Ac-2803]|uniref:Abi family protein n=1 Tax=Rathayibacter sp. VKM Ac-2803 TaxID=2609256 RepID=UPI003FA69706